MDDEWLTLVRCPQCTGPLRLSGGAYVPEGWLDCVCGRRYPIIRGIPRLVEDWRRLFPGLQGAGGERGAAASLSRTDHLKRWTQRQFGFQWTAFKEISCDFRENFFTYVGGLEPEWFRGKLGLDAGCGFGRHLIQAAACGARMVGVDYSRAIESSRQNTAQIPGVSLIQADLERLPFAPETFDFIYSIGVLHHLPDPARAFRALLPYVKPGGAIIIWVYSTSRPWTNQVIEAIRSVSTRLPLPLLRGLSWTLAAVEWATMLGPFRLLPDGRVKRRLAALWPRLAVYAAYPVQVAAADWFDRLAAPIRHYYSREDLAGWCASAELTQVRITPTGLYGWTVYAERPGSLAAGASGDTAAARQHAGAI